MWLQNPQIDNRKSNWQDNNTENIPKKDKYEKVKSKSHWVCLDENSLTSDHHCKQIRR